MLDVELQTYEKLKDSLLKDHEGSYVLIHGDRVVELFRSRLDAIGHGYRELGYIPFLVKKVDREGPSTSFFSEKEPLHADL